MDALHSTLMHFSDLFLEQKGLNISLGDRICTDIEVHYVLVFFASFKGPFFNLAGHIRKWDRRRISSANSCVTFRYCVQKIKVYEIQLLLDCCQL